MNHYAIAGLSTAVTSFILGTFVYFRNAKKNLNQLFALFSFSIAIYGFGFYRQALAMSAAQEMIAIKILLGGTVFIPVFYLHVVYSMLDRKLSKTTFIWLYATAIILEIFNIFTDWLAKDPVSKLGFKYLFQAGFLYPVLMIFFGICVVKALRRLYQGFHSETGIKQTQIKYVFYSTLIGFGGGSAGFALGYSYDFYPFNPFGSYCVTLYSIIFTYAIVKHHLMDITLLARNVLVYSIYVATGTLIFVPLIVLPVILGGTGFIWLSGFFTILIIVLSPSLYYFFTQETEIQAVKKIHNWIDVKLFREKFVYFNKLREFWHDRKTIYTTEELGRNLVEEISKMMKLENCCFYIFERNEKKFIPKIQSGMDEIFGDLNDIIQKLCALKWDAPLPVYLKSTKQIVSIEELKRKPEKYKEIINVLSEIKTEISVPLFVSRQLTAILNLGKKANGDMFHKTDFELLEKVISIAEQHLAHASFLEKIIFYSGSIAHDLKSPFKTLGYYLDDMEWALNKPEPENLTKAKKAMENLILRISKFNKMIEMMVNLNEILKRFVTGKFNPVKFDFKKTIKEITEQYKKRAEEKGLSFEINISENIPHVYAEIVDTERILNELLINAFKYTEKGKITVKVFQENKKEIITQITDTGEGISMERQKKIFEPFSRLSLNMDKVDGTGIGLASIQQLIDANEGRIWVKSEEGKGSTFSFVLLAAAE